MARGSYGFRSRFRRSIRSRFRRRYKGRKSIWKTAKAAARKVIQSNAELKWIQTYTSTAISTGAGTQTSNPTSFPSISQGDSADERIGNEIKVKTLRFRFNVVAAFSSTDTDKTVFRILVVKPKMFVTSATMISSLNTIFQGVSGTVGVGQHPDYNTTRVLYDTGVQFVDRNDLQDKLASFSLRNFKVNYSSNSVSTVGQDQPQVYYIISAPSVGIVINNNIYMSWYDM